MRLEKANSILHLARELASSSDGMTLDEIAAFSNVARRTAERMRDAVEEVFGPLEIIEDGKKKRFRITARGLCNFVSTPTKEELNELNNSIKSAKKSGDDTRANLLNNLAKKITSSLRENDRRRLSTDIEAICHTETFARQVGPRPFLDAEIYSKIREALLKQNIIEFSYIKDKGTPTKQRVIPYGILFAPRYFLVGVKANSELPLLFRLDRIRDIAITDKQGIPPFSFSLDEYANKSFGIYQEEPEDIVLHFTSDVYEDILSFNFHPTQNIKINKDKSTIVSFNAGGLLQIVRHLMTWGNTVTIVKPAKLKKLMSKEIMLLLEQHISQ